MRLNLRLVPYTLLAIPIAAVVIYFKPLTNALEKAPNVPSTHTVHSAYHYLTSWTIRLDGHHVGSSRIWPIVLIALFLLAMRAVMSLYEHRPQRNISARSDAAN